MRAQPPIPPVKPEAKFPIPCPITSFFVDPLFPSSTIPSNSCNVNKDSIDPTAAIVMAYGKIILNVCNGAFLKGSQKDAGRPIFGKVDHPPRNVSAPATSASVLTGHLRKRAIDVAMTTPPNVGGIALAHSNFSFSDGMPNLTSDIVIKAQP
jgi:hypothetical protein